MTPYRMIALVLVVVLAIMVATPARAEAMEIGTILLLVSVGVAVVMIVTYLVIANMSERRGRAEAPPAEPPLVVVMMAHATPLTESP
jgi:hypothetical protein